MLITNSFAAMNVVHSGLLKRLSDDYQIHILSTMIGPHEIENINNHFKTDISCIEIDISSEKPLIKLLRRIEKTAFFIHFKIETYRLKSVGRSRPLHYLTSFFSFSPHISASALRFLRSLIIFLSARQQSLYRLSKYHFDGIISTSPLDIRENSIVNFFKRNGIKAMAMIISWDNLTSKGIVNANHDYVLVWNKTMADEFNRFYAIFKQREKVFITGIPRFDIYFQDNQLKSGPEFRNEFQIPLSHKILLFTTSAPQHFPAQTNILEDLVEYMQARSQITIIVRCHPADSLKQYDPFSKVKNLHIWHPFLHSFHINHIFYKWLPHPDFLDSLHDMLKNCDVCVQVASTIRLDAAACNKPVISIAYDGKQQLPYHQSVRRLYDYAHQIPLNQLGTDRMVYSKEDLFGNLDDLLVDNCATNYTNAILPLIHFDKAKSVDTILSFVKEWLRS